jgi:hypothetical protein
MRGVNKAPQNPVRRRMSRARLRFAHDGAFPMLQADSSYGSQNRGDSNEIVSGRREDEEPFNQSRPRCLALRKPPNGLSQPNGSSIYFRLIVLMR